MLMVEERETQKVTKKNKKSFIGFQNRELSLFR